MDSIHITATMFGTVHAQMTLVILLLLEVQCLTVKQYSSRIWLVKCHTEAADLTFKEIVVNNRSRKFISVLISVRYINIYDVQLPSQRL